MLKVIIVENPVITVGVMKTKILYSCIVDKIVIQRHEYDIIYF